MRRRTVLEFVFVAIAGFISAYLAPRDMTPLERAVIIAAVFGAAYLLVRILDRVLPRRPASRN